MTHFKIMNHFNTLKKWLFKIFVPHMEGMPLIDGSNEKRKDTSQEQRFRNLFKKRRSALVVAAFGICLIVFGIGKSFIFFTGLIACSPFIVIFWSSFGEQLMGMFKIKKGKK